MYAQINFSSKKNQNLAQQEKDSGGSGENSPPNGGILEPDTSIAIDEALDDITEIMEDSSELSSVSKVKPGQSNNEDADDEASLTHKIISKFDDYFSSSDVEYL